TGIAGQLFNSVGKNGVNLYAIAQGGSENNISFVIKEKDLRKCLNAIHEAFFLSHNQRLSLFVAGRGTVGRRVLDRMCTEDQKPMADNRLRIRLVGIAGSRSMILNREGLDPDTVIQQLEKEGVPGCINDFKNKIIEMNVANSVFVDCTASEEVADIYL